ncbi:MAG: flagellar hook-basal body complex protein, partial [Candidatus Kuenenia stuttgartiensis]|nr:flagellar hook-basal body complex protein [Candidatus Kuenenia stuttgartiensis]
GTFGKTDGIYQSGKGSSVTASEQDGSESGSFSSFSVNTDGTLSALYSNGTSSKIAQLQLATFGNVQGLRRSGDNLYEQTDSSGEPLYTVGGTGSAGDIYNGYLEASNVDMTSELTSLIMAQRGFQLNSRVISTADEVLAEAVNLKR